MALKRKRSNDFTNAHSNDGTIHTSPFSATSSDSSILSHPYRSVSRSPSPLSYIVPNTTAPNEAAPPATAPNPSHLNSRTRKRVRDNRPDETIIHENTLQKLFAGAQHQYNPHSQGVLHRITQIHPHEPARCKPTAHPQPSLHAFWHLPGPASSSALRFSRQLSPPVLDDRCEDCGADIESIGVQGAATDAMDIDEYNYTGDSVWRVGVRCLLCGKRVCDGCVVDRSDKGIVCLGCAVVG